eukprot:PhM_4_TR10160/c0_g1_i1/m.55518
MSSFDEEVPNSYWKGVLYNDRLRTVRHCSVILHSWLFVHGGYSKWPHATGRLMSISTSTAEVRHHNESLGPKPRYGHTGVALDADRWFIFGGHSGDQYLGDAHVMVCRDASDADVSWDHNPVKSGSAPSARHNHAMALHKRKVYVYGGSAYGRPLNDMYVMELEDMSLPSRDRCLKWAASYRFESEYAPAPRECHVVLPVGPDSLLCFGGTTADGSEDSFYCFDVAISKWTQEEPPKAVDKATAPASLMNIAGAVFDPISMRVVVVGGESPLVYILDWVQRRWIAPTTVVDVNTNVPVYSTLAKHSVVVCPDRFGDLYIVGGESRHHLVGAVYVVRVGYDVAELPEGWAEGVLGNHVRGPKKVVDARVCRQCAQCAIF